MNLNSHLIELKKKHEKLEDQIEQTQRHPSASSVEIAAMKKEKLRLKEEISKVSAQLQPV